MFFLMLGLIGVGIIGGVFISYGGWGDVRSEDAKTLNNKLIVIYFY